MEYTAALARLNGRASRHVAHKTYLIARDNGDIALRYWDTDVVTFHSDNTATLNTGGFATMFTKERINEYAGTRIGADKRVWWLDGAPFFDGARVNLATGRVINPRDVATVAESLKAYKALSKAIASYIKGFDTEWARETFGADPLTPLNFDKRMGEALAYTCWTCRADIRAGHLALHIEEGDYPLSLLMNAYKARGYGNASYVLWGALSDLHSGRISRWTARDIASNVREYLWTYLATTLDIAVSHRTVGAQRGRHW